MKGGMPVAENDGSIIVDVVLDYSKFEKGASEAGKVATETGNAIEKSINPDTKGLDQLKTKQDSARKSMVEYKSTLSSLSDIQKELNQLYKNQKIPKDDYEKMRESIKMTTETLKDNQKQIEQADKSYTKSSESLDKVTQEYAKLLAQMDAIADTKMGEISDFYMDPDELDEALSKLLDTDKTYQKLSESADEAEKSIAKYSSQMNEASTKSASLSSTQAEIVQSTKNQKDAIADLNNEIPKANQQLTVMKLAFAQLVADGIKLAINAMKDFANDGIEYIKNLETSTKSMETIFGTQADSIDNWSKSLLEAYGLSEGKAKDFATSLGLIFSQAELTDQEVANMSMSMTQLSSDWASFTGLDVDTVFNKLQGGLTGNIEGLRELGINLDQATLDQYAFEEGLGDSYSELDKNEQLLVLYRAILEQSSVAMGDFSKNSDDLRNQQQKLDAQLDEVKGTFAEQLLPAITKGVTELNSFLTNHGDVLEKLGGIVGDIISVFLDLISAIMDIPAPILQTIAVVVTLIAGFIKVSEATSKVTSAFSIFNAGSGATIVKIGLIVAAVIALSAAIAAVISQINILMGKGAQAQNALNTASNIGKGRSGYANGTNSAEPGFKLVGEQGPELINFRGGEQVFTAAQTYSLFSTVGNSVGQTSDMISSPSFYKSGETIANQEITNTYYFNIQGIEEWTQVLDQIKRQNQRDIVKRR